MSSDNISDQWQVLSGQDNWQGLLDPLNDDLRTYLLHYGSMAQVTYDALNINFLSKYAGGAKFSRENLFSSTGQVKGNPFRYKAVKYLYGTSKIGLPSSYMMTPTRDDSWIKQSNWIGYVAVATEEGKVALGRRDILVAWRGTIMPIEWAKDFEFPLVPASPILGNSAGASKVHQGFLSLYTSSNQDSSFNTTSARDQVLGEIANQMELYKDEQVSISVVGHSLGGALSLLNVADIIANGYNKPSNNKEPCMVTAFVFGCPRTGDRNFKESLDSMRELHVISVKNAMDPIPRSPPMTSGYANIGEVLKVDNSESPYLKNVWTFYTAHMLEPAYLHPLGLKNGTGGVMRDLALVNKGSDALKPDYNIPGSWWTLGNKGMVQGEDGSWELDDHQRDHDDPDP